MVCRGQSTTGFRVQMPACRELVEPRGKRSLTVDEGVVEVEERQAAIRSGGHRVARTAASQIPDATSAPNSSIASDSPTARKASLVDDQALDRERSR